MQNKTTDLHEFDSTPEGKRKQVGLNIRKAREFRKMNKEELGKVINRTSAYISYLETGKRKIKVEDLYLLCKVLQVEFFYILKPYED